MVLFATVDKAGIFNVFQKLCRVPCPVVSFSVIDTRKGVPIV